MMIAVRCWQKVESLAAVRRTEQARVQDVDGVRAFRVREDVAEVPGTLAIALVFVDARPGIAPVIGAIESAFLRLDQRIDAVGIGAANGEANASQDSGGQAVPFEVLPGDAAVYRLVQAAARTTAVEAVRRAIDLP